MLRTRAHRRVAAGVAAWLSALAALVGAGEAAWASPEDVLGFGVRAPALGGTGSASAEGYEAVYANPALLSLARSRQLALGFVGARFDLSASGPMRYDPLRGTLIGAVLPLPFEGALKDRIAIGLGFFTPLDRIVRGRILYPEKEQFLLADRTQSVAVQAAVGVDIGYGVRLGVGFAALAALSGNVLVQTGADGRVGTTVDDTLIASYGPIVGASYDIGDAYRVGLTFRGELVGRFNVVIVAKDLGPIVVPPLNISGVAQYDPAQLALEVARVKGPWRVALGLTYKHWSAYPGPVEATVRCPEPVAGEDEVECGALIPADPGYKGTLTPRLGVERRFEPSREVTLSARVGYAFEPSPAPEQTGTTNYYDNDRSVVSLGYGLSLSGDLPPIDLDLFAQLQALHPRVHTKDAGVPSDNPGSPSRSTSGFVTAFGTSAAVRF